MKEGLLEERNDNVSRKVPFLTFVIKPVRRAYINLAGCNFNCRGCFAIARNSEAGQPFSVRGLTTFFVKCCKEVWGRVDGEIVITGGEPTLNPDYLIGLIKSLRNVPFSHIELSTNGYLLDEDLIKRMKSAPISLVKVDLKAFSDDVHRWYTGRSNMNVMEAIKLLNEYDLNFQVRTILIPNIIDADEIERIAMFLADVNEDAPYHIYAFSARHAREKISREPTKKEMLKAFKVAKKYLRNVKVGYDPQKYKYHYIEIREDSLLDEFRRIDEISRSISKEWNMRSIPMSRILQMGEGRNEI